MTPYLFSLNLFLFVFPIIEGRSKRSDEHIVAKNGTELLLKCAPAEYLVRTHMAPDFENPQLVRRLTWFHDDTMVASYQQVGQRFGEFKIA